ncbi:winged helix DNA-binding domain-containing protein [Asanoa sp. WMMD1127]|uniref:winged helix DNA-binding domain-containing protein n=1 Tax=Asanoa sp. WMMD1127 TaxID=3016107 RepID=UPI002417F923|nr:winged helix DNA-binding domain-containing protein [Asanoa sp. WMMD1127]MDG4827341.1 winged helix DNA-binding domain-containing protein [Asanoa sp. WMMD1127]
MSVGWEQVLRWRMRRHHLDGDKAADPVAAARRVVGVHAQVAASAVTATHLRTKRPTTAERLDGLLYDKRALVRTWAARGTMHLLPADDFPHWVAAMSTRKRETTNSWLKYHGVTADKMTDILAALPDVLTDEPLTRAELATAIIDATGHRDLDGPLTQGFGAVLKPAAFRGLLCSGPPRGRNVTFVAPRSWLGDWAPVDAETAIDRLAADYLGAFGPATPEEFARWFDLTPALAKKSFARLDLATVDVDGTPMRIPEKHLAELEKKREPAVAVLPAFDPYVTGSTRQLELIGAAGHKAEVSRPQGWISPTVVVDGWIRGTWDPETKEITYFGTIPATVRRTVVSMIDANLSTGG